MGSGVLLAALVVLWFVVLVPMVVTRGDAQDGRLGHADSGRTLQRRRTGRHLSRVDTPPASHTGHTTDQRHAARLPPPWRASA